MITFSGPEVGIPGWAIAFRLTGIGWYIVVCVIGGTVGGRALDRWQGTGPVFTLIGLFLGIIVSAYGTYQLLLPLISGSRTGDGKKGQGRED